MYIFLNDFHEVGVTLGQNKAILRLTDISQICSLRGNPHHLSTRSNVLSQNSPEPGGIHSNGVSSTGQLCSPFHSLINCRNRDRGPGDPTGNG